MYRHRSSKPFDPDQYKSYGAIADFFLSFSNPTALMILETVRTKEMTSQAISKKLRIEPKAVLAILRTMEQKGILSSFVRSQNTLYRVANPKVFKAFDRILELPVRKLKENGSPEKQLSDATQKSKKPSKKASVASIR